MKLIYFTFLFCSIVLVVSAQGVRPYLAIVKTKNSKEKGILYKVDSSNVILNDNGNFIKIKTDDIKTIQIRSVKSNYKTIDLIKIGADPQAYNADASGKMVDKLGKEMPSAADELSTTFYSIIGTALANGLAAPIHAINPNIAKFNIAKNKTTLKELSFYSFHYQADPNQVAELKKLKKLSANFKP